MRRVHIRSVVAAVVITFATAVAPASAQPAPPTSGDPESTIVSELVVVAPDRGPAWWKASKGDSVVWILGLPPKTPSGMRWDQTTLKRRLKGARLMLAPYVEWSGFEPGVAPPILPPDLEKRVSATSERLGHRIDPRHAVNVADAVHLRFLYYSNNHISYRVINQVYAAARGKRVPLVTPPVYRHYWRAGTVAPENPDMVRCIKGIFTEVEVPPRLYRTAGEYWRVGDVANMLATAPKGIGRACEHLWPGHWERTVAFQTNLIAQALEKPGKVVAAAHIGQLVAENGILQRLRAQGYTIADPSKPLEE